MNMTETTLAQAAIDARRLLRGFQAFDEVARALEKGASAEQYLVESQAARDRVIEEHARLQAELPPLLHAIRSATAKRDELRTEVEALEKKVALARKYIANLTGVA